MLASMAALFLCPINLFPLAHAAEAVNQSESAGSGSSYTFQATPGDSLSRIVRRALQLRGVTDQPTAMFCENILVAALGGSYLEIGQQVTVTYAQIDGCKTVAQILTPEKRAAWQSYANTVSFDVSYINPTNTATTETPTTTPSPTTTEAPDAETSQDTNDSDTPATAQSETSKNAGWYWWFIGAGVLVVLYFILGGPLPRMRPRKQ
jgi:hypothetical protein